MPTFLPTTISRVLSSGVTIAEDHIDYQAIQCPKGQVIYLPKSITEICHSDKNEPGPSYSSAITLIELDKPIPREMFTMDYQRARTILDIDTFEASAQEAAGGVAAPAPPAALAQSPLFNGIGRLWILVSCACAFLVAVVAFFALRYRGVKQRVNK
jgi:hypothetical protein